MIQQTEDEGDSFVTYYVYHQIGQLV